MSSSFFVFEVRGIGTALISLIITISVSGDVSVAVSTEYCKPMFEYPCIPYFGGKSGVWSVKAGDSTYVDTLSADCDVFTVDVSSITSVKGPGAIGAIDVDGWSAGTTIDGDSWCYTDGSSDCSVVEATICDLCITVLDVSVEIVSV